MARVINIAMLMLFSAAAGVWLPPFIAGQMAAGADVPCIKLSGRQVCKGQPIPNLPWTFDKQVGGIVGLSCDFEQPGRSSESGHLIGLSDITRGCESGRFVARFNNNVVLTNLWVADGRVVQIDRFNAHVLDF